MRRDRRPPHNVSLHAEAARFYDVGLSQRTVARKRFAKRTSIMDDALRARAALRGETAGKDGKAP